MIPKPKICCLYGRNEGRSKSVFGQLRINTLWQSKGYVKSSNHCKIAGILAFEPHFDEFLLKYGHLMAIWQFFVFLPYP